ncbi:MAG: hypothetical protein ABL958_05460 [Bdellovibrionia bacterium]
MRSLIVLLLLCSTGCLPTEPTTGDKPCAIPMMSYMPQVTIMLKACHAYTDEKLLVTMNDKTVIDESLPSGDDGSSWNNSYRTEDVLQIYPYDKWENRLERIEVRLYAGDCTYTKTDGTQGAGRLLLASDEFSTAQDYHYYGNGCGYEYAQPAETRENELICGTPICVPLP